ncbi:MAG: hypothetical protein PHC65_04735 [Methanobacteriaceae archaeon]|jgi:hypothetical protein|nr:hypothetical protein [Methanobacteriaceae archaeon]MDD4594925.1 hypothetical protein [Methanobacteriaceae archaeon]
MISEEELKSIFNDISPRALVKPALENWIPNQKTGMTIIELDSGIIKGIGLEQGEIPDNLNYVEIFTIEAEDELFLPEKFFNEEEYEKFLKYVDRKKDKYSPDLLSEFCEKEDIDEEERKINILADCIEEYKFMNYNDWENSIIQNYNNECDNY